MKVELAKHGFLDCELNENFTNICDVVPQARELPRLTRPQPINGESWQFLDRSLDTSGCLVGWTIGALTNEGTYGKIYKAYRMVVSRRPDGLFDVAEEPHEVVVKQTVPPKGKLIVPLEDVRAHISESLLHILAWETLRESATPWAIPQPYEVFAEESPDVSGAWKTMSLCMSYVRGRTLYAYIQKYWRPDTKTENACAFLEILAQIAYILWPLQKILRLNHRDVKVNNIMIRRRREPVVLELGGVMVVSPWEVTLIDFGFACVSCPPPRPPQTAFQAGSWFPPSDICCKPGRDIAQLLFCVHCYFPFEQYFPTPIVEALRGWLQVSYQGRAIDVLRGFKKDGRPMRRSSAPPEYHKGIYEFLRSPDIDAMACDPVAIFRACAQLRTTLA
jgi:serine/threonine protein kinase